MKNLLYKYYINNTMKKKWTVFIKKAFTFSEIVVATFISMIVMSFIFIFLSDTIEAIWNTKDDVDMISSFYDFTNKLHNFRNIYITWWILVETSTWSDIFLMRDFSWENGILLWPVKLDSSYLYIDNTTYEEKWIWFRKISSTELVSIDADVNIIYDLSFQEDQIFSDIKIHDFILIEYNSWDIFELGLIVDSDFQINLAWKLISEVPKDSQQRFNIDF